MLFEGNRASGRIGLEDQLGGYPVGLILVIDQDDRAGVGPVLGVACYQRGLRDSPSAIVLSIVSTTPLAVMMLSYLFEKTRPSPRTLIELLLAVLSVVELVCSYG